MASNRVSLPLELSKTKYIKLPDIVIGGFGKYYPQARSKRIENGAMVVIKVQRLHLQ